ncbi:MAG: HhoA/HhoB/HtrA family serine endopeptidase [Leptolyngbya sp.]|nr:HhoA/HhoB/HtrA family serine endopeptidase [Leptolyngbya sp.]
MNPRRLNLGRFTQNLLRQDLWISLKRWLVVGLAILITWVAMPLDLAQAQGVAGIGNESFVASAVRQVGPAVVRIDTEKTITRQSSDPFLDDPFLRDFFGGLPRQPQEERLRGQGSGFIIDDTGNILTNAHVVNGADRVVVTLKDGRSFEAMVEGVDEVTDLAVVKIDDTDDDTLPVATLGDSDQVQVGDWAIAVGNPLGLDNTVTLGIISTLKRSSNSVGIPGKRLEFIQTDAAINPGNSGGPLVNQQGEVIGINTAIRADAMGIGFAIPINKAKDIKDRLARGEAIAHPYIGVQIANLTPEMAQRNNADINSGIYLPEVEGVLVIRVLEGTPAAEAGLRRGDVILEVDGDPIRSADTLQLKVENSRIGDTLQLTIQRGERSMTLDIQTAELQEAN